MDKQQENFNLKKICFGAVAVYMIAMAIFYLVAGQQLNYKTNAIVNKTVNAAAGPLCQNTVITQTFSSGTDEIDSATFYFATFHRKNQGRVYVKLLDVSAQKVLTESSVDITALNEDTKINVFQGQKVGGIMGKDLELQFTSDSPQDKCVTLYIDNTLRDNSQLLKVNGTSVPGALTMDIEGQSAVPFTRSFLIFAFLLLAGILAYCVNLLRCEKAGRKSIGLNIIHAFYRYRFLLHQLVSRDFKTKYKRSALGVLWSFLNPLLTMLVQYIIFSTIFKQDIANFPSYLIIGVVFFNFFIESSSIGLTSITGNSSLISKVYIPKYIFPVSRVISSFINMLLAFVPMFAIILFTGTPLKLAFLLLPYPILCIVIFCFGVSLFLSAAMVFFRDMQFIWNVLSMLWMYATPIFYPENIIPQQFQFIFKINPMYHFIRFSRTLILSGISPDPQAYLFCFLGAVIPLAIGALLFKKTQDRFVLYI